MTAERCPYYWSEGDQIVLCNARVGERHRPRCPNRGPYWLRPTAIVTAGLLGIAACELVLDLVIFR